ncbi:MAG: 2-C-methyl-D-erythritol 2,4-cyclodiphosphate synthase [Ottowia sp.]|nr:2-C-methyl-D-erythritol 2,4-cyclodiphosphate synthase [Ottowia sp.]
MVRVGQGYDVHALVIGRPLIIGGVTLPYSHGLQGHSDADPLLHAITDAVLGAAGLGDIGQHFPDTDAQFLGANSRDLLAIACQRARAVGYDIGNVDATVIAQAPKLAGAIPEMVEIIAACLGISKMQVNVKAKTNEHLGHLGRGEGIAAQAVVLLFTREEILR